MGMYNDLYIRNLTTDSGMIPRVGALCVSPDIIPWGMEPQVDPKGTFTNNFGSDPGRALVADARNYLYVRAKNLSLGAARGTVYLYWAKSSLLLYPNQWKNNAMKTSSGVDHVDVSATNPNEIVVTQDPFTWAPQMPGGNFHYCLVARVATDNNPNPIPDTGSIQDFAGWVANNGGICWRNVSVVDASSPTLVQEMDYDQGNLEAEIRFTLTCKGCPVGSEVAFSAGTPLPNGKVVSISRTPVARNDSFIIGTSAKVPAGWKGTFSISYWSNGKAPLPGWDLELIGSIILKPSHKLYTLARPVAALGFSEGIHVDQQGHKMSMLQAAGPSREIVIGSYALKHGR